MENRRATVWFLHILILTKTTWEQHWNSESDENKNQKNLCVEWMWRFICSSKPTNAKRSGIVKQMNSTRGETITCSWHVIKPRPEKGYLYSVWKRTFRQWLDKSKELLQNSTMKITFYSLQALK